MSVAIANFRRSLLVAVVSLGVTGAVSAQTWNFDVPGDPGEAPAGWSDASQSLTPFPQPPGPYQLTTFEGESVILFMTEANTGQRPKIRTNGIYTTGTYIWRVFIPEKEANARVSTGAFLYSDQSGTAATEAREIDFEIGPGRQSVRDSIPGLPEDALLAYLTIQPDTGPGRSGDPGSSLIFQPADPANHVFPDNWYTLTLELSEDAQGRYVIDWFIQRDGGPRLQARPTYTAAYGPANDHPTDFRIYASLENLNFMGDALPTRDHFIYFDSVTFIDPACEGFPETPQPITDMEEDTTTGGFPPGVPGEWTRFGAAYDSIALTSDPALVDSGDVSLAVGANFTSEEVLGVRYNIPDGPIDMTCGEELTWRMRIDDADGSFARFVLQDQDGDIWVSNEEFPATEEWTTYSVPIAESAFFIADASGGATFDRNIAFVGFDLRPATGTNNTPIFYFDDIAWGLAEPPPAPEPPPLPVLSDMSPPDFTGGAFPPDPSDSGFPGTTQPGEWTRFGAAYDSITILEDAGEASVGTHYLALGTNWNAGTRAGIRFLPYPDDTDWTGYNTLLADVRTSVPGTDTTVELALFEADGDIWVSNPLPIAGTEWETIAIHLPADLVIETAAGNAFFDGDDIVLLGFNFDNESGSGFETLFVDNVRLDNTVSSVPDAFVIH